jgi:hypothetical protein
MPQLSNIITQKGDYIILSSKVSYENVTAITGIKEDIVESQGDISKQFRWSYNDLVFSMWIDLNLQNLNKIPFDKLKEFWIEFRYEMLSDTGVFNINATTLDVTYKNTPNTSKPFSIAYPADKGNLYWPIKLKSFTWNPYSQEKTIRLQKELSYMANQIYGHEVTYFRATPKPQSKNIHFLEYTLYGVDSNPECLKVLVPDNTFPDHKLNHNAFGIDFELPFELHIDKRYFEEIFGENSRPQKRDIIYFPLTNRIYEVVSSSMTVQFMNDFLYWHVSLVKWQPKINIQMDKETEDLINNIKTDLTDVFGEEIEQTEQDITNPMQLKDISYKYHNLLLERLNYDLEKNYKFTNYYTTVFESMYDFASQYKNYPFNTIALKYNLKNNVKETDDFVYTAWFNKFKLNYKTKKILSIENIVNNLITIKYHPSNNLIKENSIISINDTEDINLSIIGVVKTVDEENLLLTLDAKNLNLFQAGWEKSTTLYIKESSYISLIKSNDGTKGIDIEIYDNNFLVLKLNDKIKIFTLSQPIIDDNWYSIIITVSNKFNQLSYYLYTTQDKAKKTTALKLIDKQILNGIISEDYSSNLNYYIELAPVYISNIRILNAIINEELHSKFLNMQIVKDASNCLLIDNAKPVIKLPYIGQSK